MSLTCRRGGAKGAWTLPLCLLSLFPVALAACTGAAPGETSAEAHLCAGVSAEDRDLGPFRNAERIASVRVLHAARFGPSRGFRGSRATGAVVTLRPVAGTTTESLQRVIDCHLARNAALGHVDPELPNCPLVPPGVRAHASATRDGLAVIIRARKPRTAREVAVRARRLAAAAGPPPER